MTTGERIKAARKAAGMTQKELGKKMGLSFQSIAQWENDLRNPKHGTLKKIAGVLNVSVDELTDYDDGKTGEAIIVDTIQTKEDLELEEIQKKIEKGTATDEERKRLNAFYEKGIKSFQNTVKDLGAMLSLLNDTGQKKALERVEELTEIPRYQKEPLQPPQAPSLQDSETTPSPGETPPEGHTEQKEAPKQGGE